MQKLTRADIAGAVQVFDEPLSSPAFFPFPLEPVVDFLEDVLERQKDFELAARCGLQMALDACVANAGRGLDGIFLSTRAQALLDDLRAVLDKVDRERDVGFARSVLNAWLERFVPA
jgi:hypothetical protein